MPIQLNYTDPDSGQNTGVSYWFVMEVDIIRADLVLANNIIKFQIGAYNNLAARNAGKSPFKYRVGLVTLGQLSLTGASTLATILSNLETFLLTWVDPLTNTTPFSGGTIV